jgi:hypothetical protein
VVLSVSGALSETPKRTGCGDGFAGLRWMKNTNVNMDIVLIACDLWLSGQKREEEKR